ncbi:MAG: hypothetical protein OXJ38_08220 [Gammaproteobacteria bacterium]|nr:hypothetical protein [Gammaproteobacteria bacterium]
MRKLLLVIKSSLYLAYNALHGGFMRGFGQQHAGVRLETSAQGPLSYPYDAAGPRSDVFGMRNNQLSGNYTEEFATAG